MALAGLEAGRIGIACRSHTGDVTCAPLLPITRCCLAGSLDGTVRLWDAVTGKLIHTIVTSDPQIRTLAPSASGERMITGGQDGSLRVWDMPGRRRVGMLSPMARGRSVGSLSPDGQIAARSRLMGWHFTIWTLTPKHAGSARQRAWSVTFTPDGRSFAVGGDDRVVRLYDVASGYFCGEMTGHSHEVVGLAFNPRCDDAGHFITGLVALEKMAR